MNTYCRESHSTVTTVESRFQALMFPPLHSDKLNFLEWINDAKTILSVETWLEPSIPLKRLPHLIPKSKYPQFVNDKH